KKGEKIPRKNIKHAKVLIITVKNYLNGEFIEVPLINSMSSFTHGRALCVRDCSGILCESSDSGASKDIAESPTAEPERPDKKLRNSESQKFFLGVQGFRNSKVLVSRFFFITSLLHY
ncbi:MAG: hypothetical protein IKW51_06065, partial [Bacteroidales bacterium]|nr:hypothetical protein [Bacteroidales bacterium]